MRSMGIKQNNIEGVTEVIIRTKDKDIVITNAEVVCVDVKGSKSYQISGTETECPQDLRSPTRISNSSCPRPTATGTRPSPHWKKRTANLPRPSSR